MIKPICFLAMILLLLVNSCAPSAIEGRKIDSGRIKQLSLGETAANKVEELFGKPTRVEKADQGMEKYIYTYTAEEPNWWTISRIASQEFEVVLQNGLLKYYRLVWTEEEALLKQ